ncbi:MAG: serine proteinase [Pseudoflavonifractor sp.]
MAFFDDLKDRAMDLGRAGVAKSKQLAEIAKLNLENSSEEDTIKKAYVEIGKLYYAERGMSPETAYVGLCERVTAARINIEENKSRIAELKTEGDIKDGDIPPVVADVPPEEPCCDCCEHCEDDIQE